jgi:hypothetical protein
MKQLLILLTTTLLISKSYSQDSGSTLPRLVKDTLFTTSGYKIVIGQDINIGTGATPDGDFKFIRRNSSGFGTIMVMTDNNRYNKSELSLPRNMAGHKGKVVKIVTRGNKKIGITYEPLITFSLGRYEIDVDNAITSGEIVVPDEFKPKPKTATAVVEVKQQVSVADELGKLKKLYDDGVLTKEEYEAQKKKLLEKN